MAPPVVPEVARERRVGRIPHAPPLHPPAHPRPGRSPEQYATPRPAGAVITHRVGGRPQRFELRDVPLGEGTFTDEPFGHPQKAPACPATMWSPGAYRLQVPQAG